MNNEEIKKNIEIRLNTVYSQELPGINNVDNSAVDVIDKQVKMYNALKNAIEGTGIFDEEQEDVEIIEENENDVIIVWGEFMKKLLLFDVEGERKWTSCSYCYWEK